MKNSDFILAYETGFQNFDKDHKIYYQNISSGLYYPQNKRLYNLDTFIIGGVTLNMDKEQY